MSSSKFTSDKTTTMLHASAIPVTPGVTLDASGIQLFEWSHALESRDDCCGEVSEARYTWCSCFALAQIESRVGIMSFGSSLAVSFGILVVAEVISFLTPLYIIYWSDSSASRIAIWLVVFLVMVCALTFAMVRRIAKVRTVVRERFQIPGTTNEDRSITCWHTGRVTRQLVRHLDCESTSTFARVDTLPAYTQ